ncbi:MAG: flagellar hook-associated protein FlgL [Desulfobulbaceae bacterium]|nr:flagellar hook-associated protein FlgL [Desulfobulbus sp.]NLB07727.1 flagellar hook-associated protein FlgL [Desulfobulbaceae bacterium]
MKATQQTTYRMLNTRLSDVSLQLEKLRSMGASGKKLAVASDDPASVRPVLNTRKQLSNVDRHLTTLGRAADTMAAADTQLGQVENIMQRAKEIMTGAGNGTLSPADRTVLADELAQLRDQLIDTANTSVDGRFLFAGYQENTAPFVANPAYDPATYDPADSATWPVSYQGDGNVTRLEIGTGQTEQVSLAGSDLFLGVSGWDPSGANSIDSGRYDLFAELARAEEVVRSGDPAAMQTSLTDLEGAADQNRQLRAQLGVRASRVETAVEFQEGLKIDLKAILSRYEDADAIEVFNDIVQQESAFQAALSVTGRVSQLSILDYL